MKWIKYSDRKPKAGLINSIRRDIKSKEEISDIIVAGIDLGHNKHLWGFIEWLDESPEIVNQGEVVGELRNIVELLTTCITRLNGYFFNETMPGDVKASYNSFPKLKVLLDKLSEPGYSKEDMENAYIAGFEYNVQDKVIWGLEEFITNYKPH